MCDILNKILRPGVEFRAGCSLSSTQETSPTQHNLYYVLCFKLLFSPSQKKAHAVQISAMLRSRRNDIDARGFYTGVPQYIRKFGNISFDSIENPSKEVPQVMGENLVRIDLCICAKLFHLSPYIASA